MTAEQVHEMTRRMFLMAGGSSAIGLAACGAGLEPAPVADTTQEPMTPEREMPEIDSLNVEVIKGMSAAWKTGDANEIASFMHDEIAFRGAAERMTPASVGKAAFIESISQFPRCHHRRDGRPGYLRARSLRDDRASPAL